MTPRVREILSWYGGQNPGVLTNMARVLNQGRLGGTGKLVILPVDQGFEHGPARSFAKNPDAYDPVYHASLAVEAGCNAYAAPLGFIEAVAGDFAGEIPLIFKINNSDTLFGAKAPCSALTSSVEDALRLGCVGIGFTIYPGSSLRKNMYEEIARAAGEAKKRGLLVCDLVLCQGESNFQSRGKRLLMLWPTRLTLQPNWELTLLRSNLPAVMLNRRLPKKSIRNRRSILKNFPIGSGMLLSLVLMAKEL